MIVVAVNNIIQVNLKVNAFLQISEQKGEIKLSATNIEIQNAKKKHSIYNWQIADELGCHESTVIRQLRHELVPEDKAKYLKAIESILTSKK